MNERIDIETIGSPENSIPKFCSNVGINVLANSDVVLQFGHRQNDKEPMVIIDTVLVDKDHALQISRMIKETVEKSSEDKSAK